MTRRLLRYPAVAGAIGLAAVAIGPAAAHRQRRAATVGVSTLHPSRATATATTSSTSTTAEATTATTTTTTAVAPGAAPPPTLPPVGQWVPAGRPVAGAAAAWVTLLVPPGGSTPVGVVRLDTTRLQVEIFAGTSQPGGAWPHQGDVPPDLRAGLVAAFNGGFQFATSQGGFYSDGRAGPPLHDGAASLVTYADGHAQVAEWGRDATLTPDVSAVRQNLTLLVDAGAPTPAAAQAWRWGTTITRSTVTWRSAAGSDTAGDLFWAGGPGLTPESLAEVMVAAGAQRAMELDINPQWVLCATFTDAAPGGTDLLPAMHYPATHFFAPDWRDFVAVFEPATTPATPAPAPPPPSTAPPTTRPAPTTSRPPPTTTTSTSTTTTTAASTTTTAA